MGICCSRDRESTRGVENGIGRQRGARMGQVNSGSGRTTGGPVVGGNKPLVEYSKYALGDEDEKLDIEKLKKRKIFWDTQPSYSGRTEIWQLLRMVCEAEDMGTAQALCDSENIITPTGKISDGVYDQWGNLYTIPTYCIGHIFITDDMLAEKSVSKANSLADSLAEEEIDIKFRFSTGIPDTLIKVSPSMKVSKLKKKLLQEFLPNATIPSSTADLDNKIKIIYLGKVLDNAKRISDYKVTEKTLVQVFMKVE